MSDENEFSNKGVVPSDEFMSSFFHKNTEVFDVDHLNNLYNYYIRKEPYFDIESDSSLIDFEAPRKYSDNTNEYNSFCQSPQETITTRKYSLGEKKQIFKTEKTKRKQSSEDHSDKRLLRQIRNRMAAKKCRDNKKHQYKNMAERLRQAEEELMLYKQYAQSTRVSFI